MAGPRRRLYRLTPTGRSDLDQLAETITTARDRYNTFLRARDQPPQQTSDTAPDDEQPSIHADLKQRHLGAQSMASARRVRSAP